MDLVRQYAILAMLMLQSFWQGFLGKFHFHSGHELIMSLMPTMKYQITQGAVVISSISVSIIAIFGLGELAMGALVTVMILELITGLWASKKRNEAFESGKFSRFSLKSFFYLVIIAICYLMSISYELRGKELGMVVFDFMHLFFTAQIILELIVSISENLATITGKPKQHWINSLVEKVNKMLGL